MYVCMDEEVGADTRRMLIRSNT